MSGNLFGTFLNTFQSRIAVPAAQLRRLVVDNQLLERGPRPLLSRGFQQNLGARNASNTSTKHRSLSIAMGEPSVAPPKARFGLDVTRENFETVLPAVLDALDEAKFVAFDTELTGP